MAADPYRHFRIEAAEIHADLGRGVLDLERGGSRPDAIAKLLRLAHTLKGAARVVKQREIADRAHAIEDLLEPFRASSAPASREVVDALLGHVDGIGTGVAALSAPPVTAPATTGAIARATTEEAFHPVRADVEVTDALLEGLGEAQIHLAGLRESQAGVELARNQVGLLLEHLATPHGAAAGRAHALARDVLGALAAIERKMASNADQLDEELSAARDAAEQMRLVPAGALFTGLELAVRDVARAQGKTVVFEGGGGEVRLEAQALGVVQGALLQLVRNAVAHGIEADVDRRASGKAPPGRVTVEVTRRGRSVAFTCRDDGRGIDVEALRRAARRQGVAFGESGGDEHASLTDLLLRGRVSTSGTVTEISGRGIGLDLLRAAAERLDGRVTIRTEAGRGTLFELVVPLSLASVDALIVEAGGNTVAIPLEAVRRTHRVAAADVARTPRGESIIVMDRVVPLASLARLLDAQATTTFAPACSAVVIEGADGLAALRIDRLVGTATLVQRPLPDLAPAAAIVAGTSMDPIGNPRLVLDPDALVAAALALGATPGESAMRGRSAVRHAPILVVDDSLTTRMLEQSILESAGYEVEVAASAEEALERVTVETFGLILVDVEMPGMDGFSFIETMQSDPGLRDVPCILVTSRSSNEDRRRGEAVGARGYVVKGELDQKALLDRIRGLLA